MTILPASGGKCPTGIWGGQLASHLTKSFIDIPDAITSTIKIDGLKLLITLLCASLQIVSLVLEIFILAQCVSHTPSCSTTAGDHHSS